VRGAIRGLDLLKQRALQEVRLEEAKGVTRGLVKQGALVGHAVQVHQNRAAAKEEASQNRGVEEDRAAVYLQTETERRQNLERNPVHTGGPRLQREMYHHRYLVLLEKGSRQQGFFDRAFCPASRK
jgi:hypothetical protein